MTHKVQYKSKIVKEVEGEFRDTQGIVWSYRAKVLLCYPSLTADEVNVEFLEGYDKDGNTVQATTLEQDLAINRASVKVLESLNLSEFEDDQEES